MPRPIHATIHTSALHHNLERVRQAVPDAKIWAVVKANAYGHGIERAFEGLRAADGFALLDLDEAERVRHLGWRGPILLLEGVFELNSGMNRLGFTPQRYRSAWARLNALPQVDEISFMTHFSDADGPRGIAHQVQTFNAATQDLPGERSICNSAAALRHAGDAQVRGDWVRAGIVLYGSAPDHPEHTAAQWDLQPSMTLATRIIGTQQLQAGDTVGYGSRFTAEGPLTIGVAACGYADGYPRHCDTGTPVLVNGVRTRLVGRVSMDMVTVDLTPLLQAGVAAGFGSEVTLWGRAQNGTVLCIDEVARAAGTVGYELMCAVAPRVNVAVD
jgi:alanine racemase